MKHLCILELTIHFINKLSKSSNANAHFGDERLLRQPDRRRFRLG
jgi:hypothetical protein